MVDGDVDFIKKVHCVLVELATGTSQQNKVKVNVVGKLVRREQSVNGSGKAQQKQRVLMNLIKVLTLKDSPKRSCSF